MKARVLRYAAIGLATTGLGLGMAAASSASLDTTGPDSRNEIKVNNSNHADIDNHNDVDVKNDNDQHASSGDAKVRDNTTGGSAQSGDASNDNSTSTTVSLSNNTCGCLSDFFGNGGGDWDASINLTGPDSHNKIDLHSSNRLDVDNHNDVDVRNDNDQHAYTGDARVEHNTTAGDATTGDASNSNSVTTEVTVSN